MPQYWFLIISFFSLLIFTKSLYESKFKNNPFGETPFLFPLGIFVWADGVIFGIFWLVASLSAYLLHDSLLFALIYSLFWVVRSLGETIYWLNQQYSPINRNPPHTLRGHQIFHNDSIWFIYQIFWQCITVISLVCSIYFGSVWLKF